MEIKQMATHKEVMNMMMCMSRGMKDHWLGFLNECEGEPDSATSRRNTLRTVDRLQVISRTIVSAQSKGHT